MTSLELFKHSGIQKNTTKTIVLLQMSFKVFIIESAIAKHKNNIHVGISMCVSMSVANFSELLAINNNNTSLNTFSYSFSLPIHFRAQY